MEGGERTYIPAGWGGGSYEPDYHFVSKKMAI